MNNLIEKKQSKEDRLYKSLLLPVGEFAAARHIKAYELGTGPFTVDMWIKPFPVNPQLPGSLINNIEESINFPSPGQGWDLSLDNQGRFIMTLEGNDEGEKSFANVRITTTSDPTNAFDGGWHHIAVTREEDFTVNFIFDGVPLGSDFKEQERLALNLSNSALLTLQTNNWGFRIENDHLIYPLSYPSPPRLYAGYMDEVRLWNVALSLDTINRASHNIPRAEEDALIARYSFNPQPGDQTNEAASRDTSKNDNALVFPWNISLRCDQFADPALLLSEGDEPYLTVQVSLMEDLENLPGKLGDNIESQYQVVIKANDHEAEKLVPAVYTITSDEPSQIRYKGEIMPMGPSTPVRLESSVDGKLTFTFLKNEENFDAPAIRIHADFMAPDERVVFAIDRGIFTQLSQLSGDSLLDGKHALLDKETVSKEQADSVAAGIRNIVAPVVDHTFVPAENAKAFFASEDTPTIPNIGGVIQYEDGRPLERKYLPIHRSNPSFDPSSDLVKTHFLPSHSRAGELIRPISTHLVEHRIFSLDAETHVFDTDITDEKFQEMFDAAEEVKDFSAETLSKMGISSQRNIFKVFARAIKHAVEYVIHLGERIIKTVVKTVKEVAEVLKTVLENVIGAVVDFVKKVYDFLKVLFNFQNILRTNRVMRHFINESLSFASDSSDIFRGRIIDKLSRVNQEIDNYLADFEQNVLKNGTLSAANKQAADNGLPPIRATYMQDHLINGLASESRTVSEKNDLDLSIPQEILDRIIDFGQQHERDLKHIGDALVDVLEGLTTFNIDKVLIGFTELIRELVDDAFSLIELVINILFDIIKATLDQLKDLMNTALHIPIVSDIYKFITGEELTLLNVATIIPAFLGTIVVELTTGRPPFSTQEADQLLALDYHGLGFHTFSENQAVELRDLDSITRAKVAWGLGILSDSSLIGGQFIDFAEHSLLGGEYGRLGNSVSYFLDTVSRLAGFPIHDPEDPDRASALEDIDTALFGVLMMGFSSNTLLYYGKIRGLDQFDGIGNVLSIIFGVTRMGLFIGQSVELNKLDGFIARDLLHTLKNEFFEISGISVIFGKGYEPARILAGIATFGAFVCFFVNISESTGARTQGFAPDNG